MISKEFIISGMSCNHCVKSVRDELSKLNLQSFDVTVGSAKVIFDQSNCSAEQIEDAIIEAGFEIVK